MQRHADIPCDQALSSSALAVPLSGLPGQRNRRAMGFRAGRGARMIGWYVLPFMFHVLRRAVMGKITGFLEYERDDRDYEPAAERSSIGASLCCRCPKTSYDAGRALHGLRHALLPRHRPRRPDRLSGEQPNPGLERSRLSRRLAGGRAQPALDQQFSGGHRPRLSGAVRGLMHAQHR